MQNGIFRTLKCTFGVSGFRGVCVLKRSVLRRVSGRRLPNGKPQERLQFRDLRGKTLAVKKRIATISRVLEASLGPGLAFTSFA